MDLDRFKNNVQGYLDGELSAEDAKKLDAWFDAVAQGGEPPFSDLKHRQRVKDDILSAMPKELQRGSGQVGRPAGLRRLRWLAVAASIMLVAVAASLLYYRQDKAMRSASQMALVHISTQAGQMREVLLPDSSSVFLSGNTKLRYDSVQYAAQRTVFLDQGEAFFKVQKDAAHPFSVETGALSVRVLGTSFNVDNAVRQQRVAVQVKTGKVRVTDAAQSERFELTAGKGLSYDKKSHIFTHNTANPDYADIWTQGGVMMQGATFEELSDLMQSRYAIVLTSSNLDTQSFRYSLFIPHVESAEQILNMVCNIHQLKFRRKQHEIVLYR